MQNKKKFKAPNGEPDIRIALLSGHITIIKQEYVNLPEIFWTEAYSAGALSEDMTDSKTFDQAVKEKAKEVKEQEEEFYQFLKEKLKEIYKKPTGNVDRNGDPLYRRVVSLVKKAPKKELITRAWKELTEEAEAA